MIFTKDKALYSFSVYKSSLLKRPKCWCLLSLQRKLFAIASNSKLSVLTLWLFKTDTQPC